MKTSLRTLFFSFLSNKKVSEPLTVIGRDSDTEKRSVL